MNNGQRSIFDYQSKQLLNKPRDFLIFHTRCQGKRRNQKLSMAQTYATPHLPPIHSAACGEHFACLLRRVPHLLRRRRGTSWASFFHNLVLSNALRSGQARLDQSAKPSSQILFGQCRRRVPDPLRRNLLSDPLRDPVSRVHCEPSRSHVPNRLRKRL
jgi:hypothetical protein